MKKRVWILILAAVAVMVLSACGCSHEWVEADCLNPKTCAKCAVTEGEALGHQWAEATCAAPKTCTGCGITEGEALGHTWKEATCENPEFCLTCSETRGEPLAHQYGCWEISGEKMERMCKACFLMEAAEIDRERFLHDNLQGYWDTYLAQLNGYQYSIYSLEGIFYSAAVEGERIPCTVTGKALREPGNSRSTRKRGTASSIFSCVISEKMEAW